MADSPDPSVIVGQAAPVAASQNIVVHARPGPAFQADAFFNPSFQTVLHSQIAFQKCAFSHGGFQTDECDAGSGRSGYWRLFFTQMQEEALNAGKQAEKSEEGVKAEQPTPTVKKRKAKRAETRPESKAPVEPRVVAEPPPFRLRPIYTSPSTYEQLAALPRLVYDDFSATYLHRKVISLEAERIKRRKQARRRAAAFLLMAA